MSEWQPIETAPKDGSHILVYTDQGEECVVAWETGLPGARDGRSDWVPACGSHDVMEVWVIGEPTHWMPLPAPPMFRVKPCSGA